MPHILSRRAAFLGGAALLASACAQADSPAQSGEDRFAKAPERKLTDEQWRARLSPAAYATLRHEATERPFSSPLNEEHRAGVFACAGCGLDLFLSEWKFNSGTGWPSFDRVIEENIGTRIDRSQGMVRIEYHCARCLGHHGHVFNDGPAPTGLRYCNNGVALAFTPS